MQIHHLSALVAIVDAGSFTAAAKQLGMSQSSVSHAVAGLEEELSLTLLERGRQGAQPTEAGWRVLAHARLILRSLEAIRAESRNLTGLLSGRVRIGSIPSAAIAFLPKVMAEFGREHPGVEVVLLEEPSQGSQQLLDWLGDNMIDVAIMELPVDEFDVVPLVRDELCAIVPSRSRAAKARRITLRELTEAPFIMSRYSSERLIQSAFVKARLTPHVRFELQDLGTLISMVREGLGVSIVPKVAFPAVPPGVALLSLQPAVKRDLAFVMKSKDTLSPAVSAFIRKGLDHRAL